MPALAKPSGKGSRAMSGWRISTSRCSTRRSGCVRSRWSTCRPSTTPTSTSESCVEACRQRGIVFTAYCPLGRGRLLHDPVLADIAARKGRSLAQIAIRWLIQQGNIIPIPRSSNPKRIAENLDVFDFTLSDDEMKRIGALKRADGRIANPAGRAPAWD